MNYKIGDLVKEKRCDSLGLITHIRSSIIDGCIYYSYKIKWGLHFDLDSFSRSFGSSSWCSEFCIDKIA